MSTVVLTKENFHDEVILSDRPVLIDFWAAWCGPCRLIAPIMDEIAYELEGKVKVAKVNVDEQRDLASEFNVVSIPTLVVVKDGKLTATAIGVRPKSEILKILEK